MTKAEDEVEEKEKEDGILRNEFEKNVNSLKDRKLLGIVGIQAKLFKSTEEKTKRSIYRLVCEIYEFWEMPTDS